ncbi:hypothetical protein H310_03343 [Aphanomyces invadans]|uniref:Uncharacterized protein n=1 Tax=Aphanomyces invadans TaxID=157072 RepID=A0A024UHD0_9STRA|nr:hypothetical protein H310_03343 [Aphanomyces invadans]ETW05605.1 hypothetical protein H310_03343 [Aphanomyces invadans]|eukprot:XP_008865382.1 hypothetical protein H310_03343 [Aphanomyces invadans]
MEGDGLDDLFPPQEVMAQFDVFESSHGENMEPYIPEIHHERVDVDLTLPTDTNDDPPKKRSQDAPHDTSATKRVKVGDQESISGGMPQTGSSSLARASPRMETVPLVQKLSPLAITSLPPESSPETVFMANIGSRSENIVHKDVHNEDISMTASPVAVGSSPSQDPERNISSTTVIPTNSENEQSSTLQRSSKQCLICRSKKGSVVLCVGCWIPVHTACIQGNKYCGSCTIALTSRQVDRTLSDNEPRAAAIARGIAFLISITSNSDKFKLVGHVAALHLHELAASASPYVKQLVEQLIPTYSRQWLTATLIQVQSDMLKPKDIVTIIAGLVGLQNAHMSNGVVGALRDQALKYTVVDFLGWDPKTEVPEKAKFAALCGACGLRPARNASRCCNRPVTFPSVFERFRSSLVVACHAELVGVPIGCTLLEVFAHWGRLRELYLKRPISMFDQAVYCDQWKMICTALDILSAYGTRRLPLQLLEPEFNILCNVDQLERWLEYGNVDIFGLALYSLSLFPPSPNLTSVVEVWQDALVHKQDPSLGCWVVQAEFLPLVDILRYKTTVSCLKALIPRRPVGFGPCHVDFWAYLQEWARHKAIPCEITTSSRRFGNLRDLYRAQVVTADIESNPLKAAVQVYLSSRTKHQKHEGSATTAGVHRVTSKGWARYSRESGRHDTPIANTALTMNDLSIFDGLKFADGEVIDLSQPSGPTSASMEDAVDVEDVLDDDDEEDDDEGDGHDVVQIDAPDGKDGPEDLEEWEVNS